MEENMKSPVIVGVDGSPASRLALEWAAVEAVRRDHELVVINAYDWRFVGARATVGGAFALEVRAQAAELVESAVVDARTFAPGVRVRGAAVLGSPGPTLVNASRDAGLVVVGSRGRGGFANLVLGSVSQQVATHAAAPVVVVRARAATSGGPIVAGVDGSPGAKHALGMAFDEAALRGARVMAVRVSRPADVPWATDITPYIEDRDEREAAERAILLEDVGAWSEKYPDVPVESHVVSGHPADALIDISSTAQLVVVGTRGHGGFAGLLLGSVGLQLLHHAESPVLVARGATDTAA
jgi:nucleotide-binding universal stress UspA family protein